MPARTKATSVHFEATVEQIEAVTLLRLPEKASKQLPSRGQVAVRAKINGREATTVVEPDGSFGHWMKLDASLPKAVRLKPGATATVDLEPAPEWPEPQVPPDLEAALSTAPEKIQRLWRDITPMARWEWVRWVNATRNPDTRSRRVEVTIAKMNSGKRRPCCFNLSACTDPYLSRSGKLVGTT